MGKKSSSLEFQMKQQVAGSFSVGVSLPVEKGHLQHIEHF